MEDGDILILKTDFFFCFFSVTDRYLFLFFSCILAGTIPSIDIDFLLFEDDQTLVHWSAQFVFSVQ